MVNTPCQLENAYRKNVHEVCYRDSLSDLSKLAWVAMAEVANMRELSASHAWTFMDLHVWGGTLKNVCTIIVFKIT